MAKPDQKTASHEDPKTTAELDPAKEVGGNPLPDVDVPMLDVRTPAANLATRSNIVPDGGGTIGEFI